MIEAKISFINSHEGINLIEFTNEIQKFYMLSLELDENIKIHQKVNLSFKSTECLIHKERLNTSFINEFYVKIEAIFQGKIITIVRVKNEFCIFEAQISTKAFNNLNLTTNECIYVYINPSSLFIKEYLC
ncbi:hypothetical protein FPD38_03065 [Campylobacter volucris]|uniref:Molybdenum-pterin-binding protein n=1 Tax=Campylobacter volucris TaxID=1031542 RepID=A0A5C7E2P1_9BACT|nr:hypothetical protein [Campylobacter volucris]TXE88571.1 hypothetical protein FPD38_03065 [Campylobacter volucris]